MSDVKVRDTLEIMIGGGGLSSGPAIAEWMQKQGLSIKDTASILRELGYWVEPVRQGHIRTGLIVHIRPTWNFVRKLWLSATHVAHGNKLAAREEFLDDYFALLGEISDGVLTPEDLKKLRLHASELLAGDSVEVLWSEDFHD